MIWWQTHLSHFVLLNWHSCESFSRWYSFLRNDMYPSGYYASSVFWKINYTFIYAILSALTKLAYYDGEHIFSYLVLINWHNFVCQNYGFFMWNDNRYRQIWCIICISGNNCYLYVCHIQRTNENGFWCVTIYMASLFAVRATPASLDFKGRPLYKFAWDLNVEPSYQTFLDFFIWNTILPIFKRGVNTVFMIIYWVFKLSLKSPFTIS